MTAAGVAENGGRISRGVMPEADEMALAVRVSSELALPAGNRRQIGMRKRVHADLAAFGDDSPGQLRMFIDGGPDLEERRFHVEALKNREDLRRPGRIDVVENANAIVLAGMRASFTVVSVSRRTGPLLWIAEAALSVVRTCPGPSSAPAPLVYPCRHSSPSSTSTRGRRGPNGPVGHLVASSSVRGWNCESVSGYSSDDYGSYLNWTLSAYRLGSGAGHRGG